MDKLYPLDLDRALKSMSRIRKNVVAWWGAAAAQPAQLINDKEIVACSVADGRIIEVINAGAPVAMEWNQGMLFLNFYRILKGAKNRENSNKFLSFVARPEPQAEFARQIQYGPQGALARALLYTIRVMECEPPEEQEVAQSASPMTLSEQRVAEEVLCLRC